MFKLREYLVVSWVVCSMVSPSIVVGREEPVLEEVVVTATKESSDFLPAQEGTKIYSGKKTSLIDLEEKPVIVNNNLRQALNKTTGLLVSEETTPLVSIGNRGLAPDRAQYMQVLKDGIPITADMFGYPEVYYIPPFEVVDHIDFIRGGASLMYGPQPGGAINFVTKDPHEDAAFYLTESNSFGSNDFYSNYTALSGTKDNFGHYTYFHHRQSQGFRALNSQYDLYSGGSKIIYTQDSSSRWIGVVDLYNEEHGEPGGLTRANFDDELNQNMTSRPNDHFELNRYAGSLAYEKDVSSDRRLELKSYFVNYERLSWRQRGGGFGTLPSGANATSNDIQDQEFYTGGFETRLRQDYATFGSDENSLSGGFLYHHTTSPREDKRGTTADAEDGTLRKDSDRQMNYFSTFVENLFKFDKLSLTPGLRLENIWQSIQENVNLDKTTLAEDDDYSFVALLGLGAQYDLTETVNLYSNFAQGYRPKIFTQAVPIGTNETVNEDLEEGKSWSLDFGARGNPTDYLTWDASVFHLIFNDQTGSVSSNGTTNFQNVGDAEHNGIELLGELDVVGLWDSLQQSNYKEKIGSLNLFYNSTFIHARFTEGPNEDLTPQYAPEFIQKGGVEYNFKERFQISLAGTFVDEHFGNDNNTAQFYIPSYKVWDLQTEAKIYKDIVSVFGGVNNIFDEHYYPRVTSTGIDPADGRNFYAGLELAW